MPTLTKKHFSIMPSWSGPTKIRTQQLFLQAHVKGKEGVELSSVVPILELPNLCALAHCMLGMNYMCREAWVLLNLQGWSSQDWREWDYWAGHSYSEIPQSFNPLFPADIIFSVWSNVQRVGKSVMRKNSKRPLAHWKVPLINENYS